VTTDVCFNIMGECILIENKLNHYSDW